MSILIKLNEIESLKQFVNEIRTLDWDVNAYKESYVVDAKSLLGLMSLSLSDPITVKIITDDEETIKKFEEICLKYQP